MTMRRTISRTATGLGLTLLLGACGTQFDGTRPAFGYSGLAGGESSLSTYERAKADFAAARYGLAVKRFQMAMAEDPESVEAANGLAAAYDKVGRYDLSERFYRRALAMDPDSVQTLNNLGYSMLLQGRNDLALAFFRDAARIDPDNDVIAANAELAVAARMKTRQQPDLASAEPAPVPAEVAAVASRIERMTASEVLLRTRPRPEPMPQPVAAAVRAPVQPPVVPAVPLIPIEAKPLPELPAPIPAAYAPEPAAVAPSVRVAKAVTGEDAVVAAGPAEGGDLVADFTGSVLVANGTGRRHMAARLRGYLAQIGLDTVRIANADHFAYADTTITYRTGHRMLAEALSASLPIAPHLRQDDGQSVDVRLLLGGDLLEFDRALLETERNRHHADAV